MQEDTLLYLLYTMLQIIYMILLAHKFMIKAITPAALVVCYCQHILNNLWLKSFKNIVHNNYTYVIIALRLLYIEVAHGRI